MAMWELRSCLRCGGDVFTTHDVDGWYQQCLQCSHRLDLPAPKASGRRPVSAHHFGTRTLTRSEFSSLTLAGRPGR